MQAPTIADPMIIALGDCTIRLSHNCKGKSRPRVAHMDGCTGLEMMFEEKFNQHHEDRHHEVSTGQQLIRVQFLALFSVEHMALLRQTAREITRLDGSTEG